MQQEDDLVMQISGTGPWFLEGWIGDHSVEFLVDSGSSVTAMSNYFYRTLIQAGAQFDSNLRETQVVWTTIKIYQVSPVSIICIVPGSHCWPSRTRV